MKNLMLPIQDLETLYNKDNQLEIRHIGNEAAIQLRFDANEGRFKYGSDDFLTPAGTPVEFNPVAFRAFWGRPFEQYQEKEVWLELFGITQAKCTFRLLLRGASATELNKFAYFLNVRPTETFLKLKPIQRYNKKFNKTYWMLSPEFEPVKKRDRDILDEIKCALYIYSSQLIGLDKSNDAFVTLIAENYCNEDYINTEAFKFFQTEERKTLTDIVKTELQVLDTTNILMLEEGNPKGVKKAA